MPRAKRLRRLGNLRVNRKTLFQRQAKFCARCGYVLPALLRAHCMGKNLGYGLDASRTTNQQKTFKSKIKKMKLITISSALILALASFTAASAQTTLTFDNTGANTFQGVPNGYGGLNWSFFALQKGSTFAIQPNGYTNGAVSGVYTAFPTAAFQSTTSNASITSALDFNLDSGYLTAAWNDGLNVELKAYNDGVLKYDVNYTVNTQTPTLENFNFTGIDQVDFISSGGTQHPGFPANGTGPQFALDNLTISSTAVPEPASYALGLAAAGLLVALRRRQLRA